jgi:membrane dipeptidase
MLPPELRDQAAALIYAPYAKGIANSAELPNVTEGLLARGYSDADVRAILGENWLRLFESVWGS